MFFLDTDNNRYYPGRAFTYGDFQYPASSANEAFFISLGLTKVTIDARPNAEFYNISGPDNTGAYTSVEKDLAELKTSFKLRTKQRAFNLIKGTDWYVVREQELGNSNAPIPADVTTFRAAVRTAATDRCAEIDACTTVAELETLITALPLYDENTDTFSQNPAALTDFPEEPDTGVYY